MQSKPEKSPTSLLTDSLTQQIGDYTEIPKLPPNQFVEGFLKKGLRQDILHGAEIEYKDVHNAKVAKFKAKYEKTNDPSQLDDPQFFRKAFVRLIANLDGSNEKVFAGDKDKRDKDPQSATIRLKGLLGSKGAELYKLALEEEANSSEYMDAAFMASTERFPGKEWAERPIILVAGPSACGKTTAARAAVNKASEFLPKIEGSNQDNHMVFIDGGILREQSQMRKLVIQCANRKGYSGVSDLHAQSKVLDQSRDRLRATVFATPKLGAIIPETFSSFALPFVRRHKLLEEVAVVAADRKAPTSLIFCRVDGEDRSLFQRAVAKMGGRRAWKSENFDKDKQAALDLNNKKDIPESKSYPAKGFIFGYLGSIGAERWFKKNNPSSLTMIITIDVVLKKNVPPGPHNWVDAKEGDKDSIIVSRQVFDSWLKDESKKKQPTPLPSYIKNTPPAPKIQTSAWVELAILKELNIETIIRLNNALNEKILQAPNPQAPPTEEMQKIMDQITFLNDIRRVLEQTPSNNPVKIGVQKELLVNMLNSPTQIEYAKVSNRSNPDNVFLQKGIAVLDRLLKELKSVKISADPAEGLGDELNPELQIPFDERGFPKPFVLDEIEMRELPTTPSATIETVSVEYPPLPPTPGQQTPSQIGREEARREFMKQEPPQPLPDPQPTQRNSLVDLINKFIEGAKALFSKAYKSEANSLSKGSDESAKEEDITNRPGS